MPHSMYNINLDANGNVGVAKNTIVEDQDGSRRYVDENGNAIMVYHARTETEIVGDPLYNPNRHAMLMPIRFENGVPVFSFDNV